jgi:hypothetical protein
MPPLFNLGEMPMPYFTPAPDRPISSEMIRQGFAPSADEALEICHLDESASGTDSTIALATAAIAVACSAGILGLSGLTLPILFPLAGLGYGAVTAWNSRLTQRQRESEAEFLEEHGGILELAEQKLNQGQPAHKVAAAIESALRAYNYGEAPQLTLGATSSPATAQTPTIGAQTQLGAIPVAASPVEAAIAPPETYPMQASEVSPDDRRALITRLREECPALLKLVKSHPIRAVGVQRSGKTTLVKRLALLRMILMPGHRVVACTPHYKPNEGYPAVFKIAGITPDRKRDYPAISREWQSMADGVESCQEQNKTYVFDEFGLFDKAVDEDTIKSTLTSALRETMKFGIYPVFILHGETAAFMPGSKGLVTVILNSTVRVETIGEPVPDEIGLESIKPTGRFTVTWLDGSRDEGTIPTWLTEDYLLGLIGNSAPIPAPASAIAYPPPDYQNTQEQPKKTAAKATPETANDAPKLDIEKPDMPLKEIMLQCSMLAEWIEGKPGLSFAQKYANYNASRKGFTRPQFRYLLSQLGETDL